MAVPWPIVARAAIEECKRQNAKLMVVDTGPQFAKLVGDSENNSGAVLQALQPLQEAVAAGIAVIIVWHERKGGGDVSDAGRGSSAVGGAVDVILAIRRPGGNFKSNIRSIQGRSRFDDTPEEFLVELTKNGYVPLGQAIDVENRKAQDAIHASAPNNEGDAMTLEALLAAAKVSRPAGQRVIAEFLKDKKLARNGKGVKGDPYKYWRPEIHSAQTTTYTGQNESRSHNGMGEMLI
jgi:hypothetical protein